MFQTEQLTQIINELQHAEGKGYFETLSLIFKLIGLCIGPVLLIIASVFIMLWLPQFISVKMTPFDNIPMVLSVRQNTKNQDWEIGYVMYEYQQYEDMSRKRARIRVSVQVVTGVIMFLLLSPFLFVNEVLSILYMCGVGSYIAHIVCTFPNKFAETYTERNKKYLVSEKAENLLNEINKDKKMRVDKDFVFERIRETFSSESVIIKDYTEKKEDIRQ